MFKRVLVVDDEPLMLRAMGRCLGAINAKITLTSSVDEALAAIGAGVDLVITDVHLAGRTGIEVARAAAARHPKTPVIAVSAEASEGERVALGEAGVAALLSKPFTSSELIGIMQHISDLHAAS